MSTKNTRAAGLGSLLGSPAPTADEDSEFRAHQARQDQGDADATQGAPAAPARPARTTRATARTSRTTGALAHRGAGAVLPRERTKRIARDKLTVQIPASLIDALSDLVERDDTRRYDEVEEALRAHFAKKEIEIHD